MATTAFDILAARRLKAAGIKAEHAEAIVEVMGLSVNQPRLASDAVYIERAVADKPRSETRALDFSDRTSNFFP